MCETHFTPQKTTYFALLTQLSNVELTEKNSFDAYDYFNNDKPTETTIPAITDLSKHTIIVYDAYDSGAGQDVINAEFNHLMDSIVYDIKHLNNGVYPKINLVGHSRGGLINIDYAMEHPNLIKTMFSIGTPYFGVDNLFLQFGVQWLGDMQDVKNSPGYVNIQDNVRHMKRVNKWNDGYDSGRYSHIKVHAMASSSSLQFYNDLSSSGYTNPGIPIALNLLGLSNVFNVDSDLSVSFDSQLGIPFPLLPYSQYKGFTRKHAFYDRLSEIYWDDGIFRSAVNASSVLHLMEPRSPEFVRYVCDTITLDSAIRTKELSDGTVEILNLNFGFSGELIIPAEFSGKPVTRIADYAFVNNGTRVTSLTVPESVTRIGEGAFSGLTGLNSITLPFVGETSDGSTDNRHFGYIFGSVFGHSQNDKLPRWLDTVTITGGSEIFNGAFSGCANIKRIHIPDTVQEIGSAAFEKSGIVEIEIPNSVTAIGSYAFGGCNQLESLTIPFIGNSRGSGSFGSIFGQIPGSLKVVEITGDTNIPDFAFQNIENLRTVVLSGSVRSIGNYAFRSSGLSNMILPEGLESIGTSAFSNCNLTSIVIPGSVQYIGSNAFANNLYLERAEFEQDGRLDYIGWFAFANNPKLNYAGIVNRTEPQGTLVIPNSVIVIDQSAFSGCTGINRLVFEEGSKLTTIGQQAFASLGLKEVTVPASVTNIDSGAFFWNFSLTTVTLERSVLSGSITALGSDAFEGAPIQVIYAPDFESGLAYRAAANWNSYASRIQFDFIATSGLSYTLFGNGYTVSKGTADTNGIVYIPGTYNGLPVTGIADQAFQNSTGLTGVVFEDESLRYIGSSAFDQCVNLRYITIPAFVVSIGDNAFAGCGNLSVQWVYNPALTAEEFADYLDAVTIPDYVTKIGAFAFKDGVRLKNITIPTNVESIGEGAFADCSKLNTVTVNRPSIWGIPALGPGVFNGCISLTKINVPGSNSETQYKAASGWNVYSEKIRAAEFEPLILSGNGLKIHWNTDNADFLDGGNYRFISIRLTITATSYAGTDYSQQLIFGNTNWDDWQFDLTELPFINSVPEIQIIYETQHRSSSANYSQPQSIIVNTQSGGEAEINGRAVSVIAGERHLKNIGSRYSTVEGIRIFSGDYILANDILIAGDWQPLASGKEFYSGLFDGNHNSILYGSNYSRSVTEDHLFAGKTAAVINLGVRYEAASYTVIYNSNIPAGSNAIVTGTTANSTHPYHIATNLRTNGYILADRYKHNRLNGWIFAGWATGANGGVVYANGQSVTNITTGASVTLYAKWNPAPLPAASSHYLGLQVLNMTGVAGINRQWTILIKNNYDFPILVEYNSRMCFQGDAKDYSGLTDLRQVVIPAYGYQIVDISANLFAAYITTSIVFQSGNQTHRLVTYANDLNSNGSMKCYKHQFII